MVPLKQGRRIPPFKSIVVEKRVREAEWPVEAQVVRVVVREIGRGECSGMCG
jgi:hypothetical protein